MTHLALYDLTGCPYCRWVRTTAARLGLALELRDVRDPVHRKALLDWRGRATVPVLAIPGAHGETLLPESADIVAWLEAHARELAAAA